MHESNGLRFDIIIKATEGKRTTFRRSRDLTLLPYSQLGVLPLALFFLTAGFTQKIEINKPLLKINTADTWSLKYVVIRDFTGLVA